MHFGTGRAVRNASLTICERCPACRKASRNRFMIFTMRVDDENTDRLRR